MTRNVDPDGRPPEKRQSSPTRAGKWGPSGKFRSILKGSEDSASCLSKLSERLGLGTVEEFPWNFTLTIEIAA